MNLHPEAINVIAAGASGLLFAIRGAARVAGAVWPLWTPLRILGFFADALLFVAVLLLAAIVRQFPATGWLMVKALLVVGYIALGAVALTRAHTPRARALYYIAALLLFVLLVSLPGPERS